MSVLRRSCFGTSSSVWTKMSSSSSSFRPVLSTGLPLCRNSHTTTTASQNLFQTTRMFSGRAVRGRPRKTAAAVSSSSSSPVEVDLDTDLLLKPPVTAPKPTVSSPVTESITSNPVVENDTSSSNNAANLWAWIPPRDKLEQHTLQQTYQIPVVKG